MNIDGRRWQVFAAVMLITAAVFVRTVQGEIVVWDDDINIYRNPNIQRLIGAELAWMYGDIQHALRYKPLSWLTWALLHQVFGLNAGIYHAANVVLHSINAGLLFLVIRELLMFGASGVKL